MGAIFYLPSVIANALAVAAAGALFQRTSSKGGRLLQVGEFSFLLSLLTSLLFLAYSLHQAESVIEFLRNMRFCVATILYATLIDIGCRLYVRFSKGVDEN